MFNKYKWLEEQKESLKEYINAEVANGNTPDYGELCEQLQNNIDREVIYYNDCWNICRELAQVTEWDKMEFGPVTSLQQLAYISLYEYANETLDLEELLNETINENA
jgi:thiamine pyrophosphate-dependent acetolactate synthase large subunit-like protein